ncbi:major facilitator superfamily transporter [Emericellopsis cladophorae]|uniref:Major facilitator superfamily transporter n=1 Tax=Emericellopsis cladophorae TaxID=2686198 RepID=A0A9P9Y9T3_9HYPO|nr:major facilitator superfamily transporter [Emericellopsis cladophorae]KAI6786010.1 major facilitator superfamily transporter [Emericellopsis cladophorae]
MIALFDFDTSRPRHSSLRGIRCTALESNYLSIPVYISASISTAINTFVSDLLSRRAVCLLHRVLVTWVANNTQPDPKRSITIALLMSLANASGLVSS